MLQGGGLTGQGGCGQIQMSIKPCSDQDRVGEIGAFDAGRARLFVYSANSACPFLCCPNESLLALLARIDCPRSAAPFSSMDAGTIQSSGANATPTSRGVRKAPLFNTSRGAATARISSTLPLSTPPLRPSTTTKFASLCAGDPDIRGSRNRYPGIEGRSVRGATSDSMVQTRMASWSRAVDVAKNGRNP